MRPDLFLGVGLKSVTKQLGVRQRRRTFFRPRGEALEPRLALTADLQFSIEIEVSTDSVGDLVTLDSSGNIYNASRFTSTIQVHGKQEDPEATPVTFTSRGGYDVLLTKYSSNGELIWARTIGTTANDGPLAGLDVDNSGNVYIAGEFSGNLQGDGLSLFSNGSTDAFVAKLDSDGQTIWGTSFGSTGADRATALAVDATGNLFIGGTFSGVVDFAPGNLVHPVTSALNSTSTYLLNLGREGEFGWVNSYGGNADQINIEEIDLDTSGNIYFGGRFSGTPDFDPGVATTTIASRGLADIFISRVSKQGEFVWAKGFGNSISDDFAGLEVSPIGKVFVAANMTGSSSQSTTVTFAYADGKTKSIAPQGSSATNAYVAEYDLAGGFQRATVLGRNETTRAKGLAADPEGNVYVAGEFSGTTDMDPQVASSLLVSSGSTDIFLTKLLIGSDELAWSFGLGKTAADTAADIAVDISGNLLITGTFSGEVSFDPRGEIAPLQSAGIRGGYLASYRQVAQGAGGQLDASFGTEGRVLSDYSISVPRSHSATSVVQQGTNIIVAGTIKGVFVGGTQTGADSVSVGRHLSNGKPDSTFGGGDGKVSVQTGYKIVDVWGVLLQSSNRIVVYGNTYDDSTSPQHIFLTRFLANGTVDTSFGTNGFRITAAGFSACAGLVQSDQKIVLAGYSTAGGGSMLMIRYDASGNADNSFNGNGTLAFHSGRYTSNSIFAIAQQGSNYLISGKGFIGRITSTGGFDTTFGGGFIDVTSKYLDPAHLFGATAFVDVYSIAVTSSGIIAGGRKYLGSISSKPLYEGVVLAFSNNGSVLSNFGTSGRQKVSQPVQTVLATSSGKIIAAGTISFQEYVKLDDQGHTGYVDRNSIYITRLSASGAPDSFGTNGIYLAETAKAYTKVALTSDQKILLPISKPGTGFTIGRLTADGLPDTSLNKTGFVTTTMTEANIGYNFASASAIDSQGRILVAGNVLTVSGSSFGVTRYNQDGTIDESFGNRGYFFGKVGEFAYSIAVASDGSIVVGGKGTNDLQGVLYKLDVNGKPIGSFASQANKIGPITALAIDSSGRIVVTGVNSVTATAPRMFVARFTSSGALDKTYATNGIASRASVATNEVSNSIVTYAGKAVIGGYRYNGSTLKNDFAIWQYDSNGKLERTFSDNFSGDDYAAGIAFDGSVIYAAGTTGNKQQAIVAYKTNGTRFTTFGTNGKVVDGSNIGVGGISIDINGRLVVAAISSDGYVVTRYLANGGVDLGFGPQGRVTIPTKNAPGAIGDVLTLPGGKILVFGTSYTDLAGTDFDTDIEFAELGGRNDPLTITLSNSSVPENSLAGTLVGTLSTTAAISDFSPTYVLTESAGGRFRLNGNRLEVANSSLLNFETGAEQVVKIRTMDAFGRVHYATFVIKVSNVNETPSGVLLSPNTLPEQSPIGSVVGLLTGFDPDFGGASNFALVAGDGDTDNARFSIDAAGRLRTAEVFDFETQPTLSIRVRTTDAGGLFAEQISFVHVTYVDSIPPFVSRTTADHAGGFVYAGTSAIEVVFSEDVVLADENSNFELRNAGVNGLLGDEDDELIPLTATYAARKTSLTPVSLPSGLYRLTVHDLITDIWNNQLDGDANGSEGGDYHEDFVVISRTPSTATNIGAAVPLGGTSPRGVTQGDFNLDGNLDLAVINSTSNTVSVLLGDGQGGFVQAGPPIPTEGDLGYGIITARLNGDLYDDLAVISKNQGTVSILLGDGNGAFTLQPTFDVASNAYGILAGNFDEDDKTDLVVYTPDGLFVMLGQGGGTFAPNGPAISTGGAGARFAVAGLFNADEFLDIAVANTTSKTVSILQGTGTGSFVLVGTPFDSNGISPSSLAVGMIDSDTNLDLVVVNSDSLTVFLGDGDFGFQPAGSFAVQSPTSVAIAQVDSDPIVDLVVTSTLTGQLLFFSGEGNGTFASPVVATNVGNFPQVVIVDDFDSIQSGLEAAVVNLGSNDLQLIGLDEIPPVASLKHDDVLFSIATTGQGAGQIVEGTGNAFDGLNRLQINAVDFEANLDVTFSDEGQSLVIGSSLISGLEVSRKITVPQSGDIKFVRTIDSFTNVSETPITVSVDYFGNLGSDSSTTVFATQSGDLVTSAADWWVGTDGGSSPAVINFLHGRNGIVPTLAEVLQDNIHWQYDLSLEPGESIDLASFTIIAGTRSAAIAAATDLVSPIRLNAAARSFMTLSAEASLANFVLNSAPTDLALTPSSIDENRPVGSIVGAIVVTDPDPQNTFTYSLVSGVGDTDNQLFSIDASGNLRTGRIFDFEAQPTRSVRVRVTDQGDLSFEKSVTIQIGDIYEPPVDAEPNDTNATALVLAAGTVASGFIGNGSSSPDIDTYRISASADQIISFAGYGYGGYNSGNQTTLHLYDAAGNDVSNYLSYFGTYYSITGGTYYAAVSGPEGYYSFSYSTLTFVGTEVEPNNTTETAQPIDVAVGSTASITAYWGEQSVAGDPDLYAVFVPANTVLEVSVQSAPGYPSSNSAKLAALDATGTVLATNPQYYLPLKYYSFSDQTIYVRFSERSDLKQGYQIQFDLDNIDPGILDSEPNDIIAQAVPLAAGTITAGFLGNGAVAADVDVYQFTADANQLLSFAGYGYGGFNYGNSTTLHLYDDNGNDLSAYLSYFGTYYSTNGGTLYAAITGPQGAYTFSYSAQTFGGTEVEPNNTLATAQSVNVAVGVPASVTAYWGEQSVEGDPDLFAVFVPANTILQASVESVAGFPSSGSSKLAVLDAAGNVQATNPHYSQPVNFYSFADQTVYVRFTERSDLKQAYRINFSLSNVDLNILDAESNDTLATAQPIAAGTTVAGFIGNGPLGLSDVDTFQITVTENQLISFSGYGYGGYNYNNQTTLRLYDADGSDLSSYLSYFGTYYSTTGGTYFAAITGVLGPYTFGYNAQTFSGTEIEPNNTIDAAQAVQLEIGTPVAITAYWGEQSVDGDPDLYKIFLPANTVLSATVQSVNGFPSSNSSKLAALDAAGNILTTNPHFSLPLTYTSLVGQTVYVRFTERADLKQAYKIEFVLNVTGSGLNGPRISPIADQITSEDEGIEVPFTVESFDPLDVFTVTVTSSNEALLPADSIVITSDDSENWSLYVPPAADQSGFVTVTVTATDTYGQKSSNRFVLQVLPVDDPPSDIELSNYEVAENSIAAGVGLLSTIDPDGGPAVSFEILFDPAEAFVLDGSYLRLRDGVTFDFEESSSYYLIIRASDSSGITFDKDISISVLDVNEPPQATALQFELAEDSSLAITLIGTDIDGDAVQYVLVTLPTHGSLTGTAPDLTYIPDLNYFGSDSFSYYVSDGFFSSPIEIVDLQVTAENDAPSFTSGGNVAVKTGSGFKSVTAWAKNISAGSVNENQTLDFKVEADNPTLFSILPAIDAATGTLTFTVADGTQGDTNVTVWLEDSEGGRSVDRVFKIFVRNVAPAASITGPAVAVPGMELTYRLSATDLLPADQTAGFTFKVVWGDGTSTSVNGATQFVTHTYTKTGTFVIKATATDQQNATSAVVSTVVDVDSYLLRKGTLFIGGSAKSEKITVQPAILASNSAGKRIVAKIGTKVLGPTANSSFVPRSIVIYGNGGNDLIRAASVVIGSTTVAPNVPLLVLGGSGDDKIDLRRSVAATVVTGGDGNDELLGSSTARDILVGGNGADDLDGGGGEDVLIGGRTAYDDDPAALDQLLAAWTSTENIDARRETLVTFDPVLPRLIAVTKKRSVFDDAAIDNLMGGDDGDWFLATTVTTKKDVLKDRLALEALTKLPTN